MIDFQSKTHIKIQEELSNSSGHKSKRAFRVLVKTNSNKTELKDYDSTKEAYRIDVKAQPIDGKANLEIIKFFKKNYKLDVEIISGQTSREKLLRIK